MSEQELRKLYRKARLGSLYQLSELSNLCVRYFQYKLDSINLDCYKELIKLSLRQNNEALNFLLSEFFITNNYLNGNGNIYNYQYWTITFKQKISLEYNWLFFLEQLENISDGIIWANPVEKLLTAYQRQVITKHKICFKSDIKIIEKIKTIKISELSYLLKVDIDTIEISNFEERFRYFYLFYGYGSQTEFAQGMNRETNYLSKMLNKKKPIFKPREETKNLMAEAFLKKIYNITEQEQKNLKKYLREKIDIFFQQAETDLSSTEREMNMSNKNQQIKWCLTIDENVNNLNENEIQNKISEVMKILEEIGEGIIWVNGQRIGSIILDLESNIEVFNRIDSLYKLGELDNLLNVKILQLKIQELNQESEEEPVNLKLWFQNIFSQTWKPVEELLTLPHAPVWSVLLKRAKAIDLTTENINFTAILIIRIGSEMENNIIVEVQVYPEQEPHLPQGLKLTILDEEDQVFYEAIARSNQGYIRCDFDADAEDEFKVILSLEDAIAVEKFVL